MKIKSSLFLLFALCLISLQIKAQNTDAIKLDAVKVLAVAYCYGPTDATVMGDPNAKNINAFDAQPLYDYLEQKLTERLTAANIKWLPLDQSKPVYSSMLKFMLALNALQGKPAPTQAQIDQLNSQMEQLKKFQAMAQSKLGGKGSGLTTGNGGVFASAGTSVPITPLVDKKGNQKPGQNTLTADYSETALQVYGKMGNEIGAGSYLTAFIQQIHFRESTKNSKKGTDQKPKALVEFYFRIFDTNGNAIYKSEKIEGVSKDVLTSFKYYKGTSYASYEWNNAEAQTIAYQAIDDALDQVFQHLAGK